MSRITFGIRVVDENGDGVEGVLIYVSYPHTHSEEYTDVDGWAVFDRDETFHGGVRADFYIEDDKVADQVWIDRGEYVTFSYTL